MVRHCATIIHQLLAIRSANKTIEQTVSVNVARLFPLKKETDAPEAVNAHGYARKPLRILFDGTDRAQAARMQQGRRKQKRRVKYLWRARNFREPAEFSNDERENHWCATNVIASAEAARPAAH